MTFFILSFEEGESTWLSDDYAVHLKLIQNNIECEL